MTATEMLLGFEGRISRGLFNAMLALIGIAALADQVVVFRIAPLLLPPGILPMIVLFGVIFGGAVALLAVSALAAKRLHDLDRSGWHFVGFVLAPLAGLFVNDAILHATAAHFGLLALIAWGVSDLVLAPGVPGPNRFGRDPLEGLSAISDLEAA